MRHHPDHPRPWSEIQPTLNAEEQAGFLTYAAARGFTALDTDTAADVESLLADWRTAGSPTAPRPSCA